MVLGTLASTLLGNMLSGKGVLRAGYRNKQGEGVIRAGYNSSVQENSINSIKNLKYKSIIKMNLDLMVFIQEIIYLKQEIMMHI